MNSVKLRIDRRYVLKAIAMTALAIARNGGSAVALVKPPPPTAMNPRSTVIVIADDSVPIRDCRAQGASFVEHGHAFILHPAPNAMATKALEAFAYDVDELIAKIRRAGPDKHKVFVMVWTYSNPLLLYLPLLTSGDRLIARASDRPIGTLLMSPLPDDDGPRPIERLLEAFMRDGRSFVVNVHPCCPHSPIVLEDEL